MPTKKKNQGSTLETIGVDIGYGVTKAVNEGDSVSFPSVWGRATETRFQTSATAENYRGDDLTDDEGDWLIGYKAQKHAGVLLDIRGRSADEESISHVYRLRLLKAAIGKLYPGLHNGEVLHFHVATGLPVDHMRGAGAFKRALIGQHRVQTDQGDFIANIADVSVMPQPYGTIYRQMLTEVGRLNPCHTYTRTGVCDVGTYTIDLALDDDGEYLDDKSDSVEAGVYRVRQAIESEYARRYGQRPTYRDVTEITRNGCVRVSGQIEDFTDVLKGATADLSEVALNLIQKTWGVATDVDVIYVSGGGAGMVYPTIKGVYKQAQLTEESQLANAQGYYNYARFKATGQ